VADSSPEGEALETRRKVEAAFRAVSTANRMAQAP
jgi:anthranilate/para-aminobenzoate synthase component I